MTFDFISCQKSKVLSSKVLKSKLTHHPNGISPP